MPSPFNPRNVEVLSAALAPEGVNPIGRLARDVLVQHVKRLTPGNYSAGARPAFRSIFFAQVGESPFEASITPLTGLGDGFFAEVAVAMLCRRMADATSKLRPQLPTGPMDADLAGWSRQVRQNSYRFYAEISRHAESPIRAALAAFPDEPSRAEARRHYITGITSPTWVNDKLLQDGSGNWADQAWELYHHWIKLTALGTPVADIDAAIARVKEMGLPVPSALMPGVCGTSRRPGSSAISAATTPPTLPARCSRPSARCRSGPYIRCA